MESSFFIRVGQYKSPLRVLAGIFLRSRETVLPHDPSLPHHEFGPKMISVCVNLAMNVGLRASVTCLKIVFEWLGVDARLPHWTTVRRWLMRWGVAELEVPAERADDWIWMADHSNQIGQEKALAVVGLRASNMPPPEQLQIKTRKKCLCIRPRYPLMELALFARGSTQVVSRMIDHRKSAPPPHPLWLNDFGGLSTGLNDDLTNAAAASFLCLFGKSVWRLPENGLARP